MVEFGAALEITYVMGGLAREFEEDLSALVIRWLDDAAESGMPLDPRVWHTDGVRSTYPACIAFRAAAEQGPAVVMHTHARRFLGEWLLPAAREHGCVLCSRWGGGPGPMTA